MPGQGDAMGGTRLRRLAPLHRIGCLPARRGGSMRGFAYKTVRLAVAAMICAAVVSCGSRQRGYVAFRGYAQGGTYTVKARMDGVKPRPQEIAARIDTILARIDGSLSGYNKGSLLSRFNRGETIVPDEIFIEIYGRAYDLYEESDGVVDVACGPLFDIWGFGFTEQSMPSGEAVAQARAASGMSRLRRDIRAALRPDGSLSARDLLSSPGDGAPAPVLNFNAIAQGYSCDLIARYLHGLGIHDMLVDIGEIWCEGRNPDGKPWTIGIDRPIDGNNTPGADMQALWRSDTDGAGEGVVTSGNYRKYYVRDGRKYSHTIDPRSGCPVSHNLLSATVVAADATTADAVATWCMVVGLDEAGHVLRRLGLEGCLIYADGDGSLKCHQTAGFRMVGE